VGVDKHQGIYRESLTGSVARRFVFIKQLIIGVGIEQRI
jgi:hypothetical protein